jgi:hypothetical protein
MQVLFKKSQFAFGNHELREANANRPELLENHHQWFVQAFESGIMDHDFTVKSALIGGIALFTGHGLLLSSDVAWVVAAIGAILATAMAHVQRIGATLLLGISLGFRSDRFSSPWLFDTPQTSEHEVFKPCNHSPAECSALPHARCCAIRLEAHVIRDFDEYHLLATNLRRS